MAAFLALWSGAQANAGAAEPELGQLPSSVETIVIRKEIGREVCLLGQRSRGGCLVLTPDTCFFYGRLHLADPVKPKWPGTELNGDKTWTRIEGLDEPGRRVIWPLWLPEPATLKLSVLMQIPAAAAGATLEISIAGSKREVVTQPSDGSAPQPWAVELPVTTPGLHELTVAFRKAGSTTRGGAILQMMVRGPGIEDAVLVRSRWRAAAIHARFGSSGLEKCGSESRLWVMEARPLPCEDSMYAPITTPFGYFGSTFNPDGTSGGINFSLWSYGRGAAEPPVEQLSHLLALGDPRLTFGGFGHEGTGVKPRGWNPFEGATLHSVVLALRLDPGDPYDTYTGYYLDPRSGEWRLYAAGRKWHKAERGTRNLLPGSFVEVPGPPEVERSAHIRRGVDFRGWCRDTQGAWHPVDQMFANDLRADEIAQKTYQVSADGWFRMAMGGLEQYRYPISKPVIRSEKPQSLPDYMQPTRLAVLDRASATIVLKAAERTGDKIALRIAVAGIERGKLTVYYGAEDMLTFAERWQAHGESREESAGEHTILLPATSSPGFCRALLQGPFGSVWSYATLALPK